MMNRVFDMKEMTKGEITKEALRVLALSNNEVWPENNMGFKGRKFLGKRGKPDIVGYCRTNGIAVFCEVKTKNDYFSPGQIDFINEAIDCNCYCLVAGQNDQGFYLTRIVEKLIHSEKRKKTKK